MQDHTFKNMWAAHTGLKGDVVLKKRTWGWGCSSVSRGLASTHKVVGLSFSTSYWAWYNMLII